MSKRKSYVLGWVIGIVYSDGHEWLFHKRELCSLNIDRKESDPTVYDSPEAARQAAEKLGDYSGMGPMFIRVYWLESHRPQKLQLVSKLKGPHRIDIRPAKAAA